MCVRTNTSSAGAPARTEQERPKIRLRRRRSSTTTPASLIGGAGCRLVEDARLSSARLCRRSDVDGAEKSSRPTTSCATETVPLLKKRKKKTHTYKFTRGKEREKRQRAFEKEVAAGRRASERFYSPTHPRQRERLSRAR